MLTVNTIPLQTFRRSSFYCIPLIRTDQEKLLGLAMSNVLAATAAELAELETLSRLLLVLGRHVVTLFAFCAL